MNSSAKTQILLVREMLAVPGESSVVPIPDPELRDLVNDLWGLREDAREAPEVLYDKFRPGLSARRPN